MNPTRGGKGAIPVLTGPTGLSLPPLPAPAAALGGLTAPTGRTGLTGLLPILQPIPGLSAWSLDCRRKTLRGTLRAWLLNSRDPVR